MIKSTENIAEEDLAKTWKLVTLSRRDKDKNNEAYLGIEGKVKKVGQNYFLFERSVGAIHLEKDDILVSIETLKSVKEKYRCSKKAFEEALASRDGDFLIEWNNCSSWEKDSRTGEDCRLEYGLIITNIKGEILYGSSWEQVVPESLKEALRKAYRIIDHELLRYGLLFDDEPTEKQFEEYLEWYNKNILGGGRK